MTRQRVATFDPQPCPLLKWVGLTFLLLLVAGCVYNFNFTRCLDGCSPYHNTTDVADFEGDGDLDVLLFNLLRDGESNVWAGSTV